MTTRSHHTEDESVGSDMITDLRLHQAPALSNPHYSVRREKVHVPSGCESRPATIAPAGSNRSVGGGNELDEASGVEGRHWRLGEQAGRNASER